MREWASNLPEWIEVIASASRPADQLLAFLDSGEAAAITLAQEIRADAVLLDEREARRVAVAAGLRIAGTIGILERAAEEGLIDLSMYLDRLQKTNFRIDPNFLKEALARDAVRRNVDSQRSSS